MEHPNLPTRNHGSQAASYNTNPSFPLSTPGNFKRVQCSPFLVPLWSHLTCSFRQKASLKRLHKVMACRAHLPEVRLRQSLALSSTLEEVNFNYTNDPYLTPVNTLPWPNTLTWPFLPDIQDAPMHDLPDTGSNQASFDDSVTTRHNVDTVTRRTSSYASSFTPSSSPLRFPLPDSFPSPQLLVHSHIPVRMGRLPWFHYFSS
jgi:hypothetical protein